MKPSDEAYTIMIFCGPTANPLRVRIKKTTVRRLLITTVLLVLFQSAILAHYVVQTSQVAELATLRKEIAQSRRQTSMFSAAIDDMKQRMLAMQQLNRKLQTMFGLEIDEQEGMTVNGQGGEELPYDQGEGEKVDGLPPSASRTGAQVYQATFNHTVDSLVMSIEHGLTWLNEQAVREQQILDELAATAKERAERWASTPSIWPVKGSITSRFGPRISPFTGKKAFHSGLDIGAPPGTEVRAPAAGKVVVPAYDARIGNFIRIDHGYGIETTYGHLSKILVKYGQRVKRGDVIGLVGSTGKFSTGPHLHYQIAVNDKVVDPVQYILD
ncbi:MAG: M23 family metallopeptidase [Nitrospirae bacterium]|nr:MAG: M23 family metallopeptidase [Nitrospirota bacterium]